VSQVRLICAQALRVPAERADKYSAIGLRVDAQGASSVLAVSSGLHPSGVEACSGRIAWLPCCSAEQCRDQLSVEVADTVVMGRTWDTATHSPSPDENLASDAAMAPPVMTVPAGTTVTFVNPAGNKQSHCAESFFDPASFKIGPIVPGSSGSYHFVKLGDYFYNDCAGFPLEHRRNNCPLIPASKLVPPGSPAGRRRPVRSRPVLQPQSVIVPGVAA
jgi:hypothetical protein